MVFNQGKGGKRARSSAAPDAAPGTSPPIATLESVYTVDMSSYAELRGQVVSLSSGSCHPISAMLAPPRVLKNGQSPPSAPARPAPVSAPRAAAWRPPAPRASRRARPRALATPVERYRLSKYFSL